MSTFALATLLLCSVFFFSTDATKIIKCRSTYRGTREPACSLRRDDMKNDAICLSNDVESTVTGYFSVGDNLPQPLCYTLVFEAVRNIPQEFEKGVWLYRGFNFVADIDTCEESCKLLREAYFDEVTNTSFIKIFYFSCYKYDEGNSEDLTSNWNVTTQYDCSTDDKYFTINRNTTAAPTSTMPATSTVVTGTATMMPTTADAADTTTMMPTTADAADTTTMMPTTADAADTTTMMPTTAAPDTTTASADTTTAAPDTTTAAPDTTTAAPDTTTDEPDTTTEEPDTTTAAPDTTTDEPDTTTDEPDTTTDEPDTTTDETDTTTEGADSEVVNEKAAFAPALKAHHVVVRAAADDVPASKAETKAEASLPILPIALEVVAAVVGGASVIVSAVLFGITLTKLKKLGF